jgi:anti-sigma factor RsiW
MITEDELHAYVDGRLSEDRRAAVEQWLAARPNDAARVAAYRHLAEQWRAAYAPVLHEPVPEELVVAARKKRRPRALVRVAAAIVLAAAIGALTMWQLSLYFESEAASEMVHRAAVAHAVYTPEVRHPVEPQAEAHLLAWLSERLAMPVRAPNLEAAGLTLIGGRLLPGEKQAAALLMYEGQTGPRLTLYWGPEFKSRHETGLRFARSDNGTSVYYWIDDECGYAIASADLARNEFLRVALLAYGQLEK